MDTPVTESGSFELILQGRARDVSGLSVRRALPALRRRTIGPFVFFDHMGPSRWDPGGGLDVRPHPHIALATVTYLFEGEIDHRDSLGTFRTIRGGDVNWMIAGHGIAHSERTPASARSTNVHLHGIQSWVALPVADEEMAPAFEHHPSTTIPRILRPGVTLDVIAGTGFGATSPVGVRSPTLYVHARLEAKATLTVDAEHEERAIYVVEGSFRTDGLSFGEGTMLILRRGREREVAIEAERATRLMLLGGAPLDGERHLWWNFVSSSTDRIERAKGDWRDGRFPVVPGDEIERIPLPES